MLRRPSDSLDTPHGDGCSSTAFDAQVRTGWLVWGNPADRGSNQPVRTCASAVP
jgi:hypothetical protein